MRCIFLSLLFSSFFACGQNRSTENSICNSITFKKYFSIDRRIDILNIKQIPTKEYIVTGEVWFANNSYPKAFLAKLSETGDLLWFKTFGYPQPQFETRFGAVTITSDNKLIITASSTHNQEHFLILKFDFDGNIVWKKKYDYQFLGIWSMKPDDNGGAYFCGSDGDNFCAGKLNSDGNLQWLKTYYEQPARNHMNGIDLTEHSDFLYITGTNFINGATTHIVKINKNTGDLVWSKVYGSTVNNTYDVAFTGIEVNNNNLAISGMTTRFSPGGLSPALLTFDTAGNCLNATAIVIPGQHIVEDIGNPVRYSDRVKLGVFTPSVDSNDVIVFKVGPGGINAFKTVSPGHDVLRNISDCADSGFISSTLCYGNTPANGFWLKYMILKVNSQGSNPNCPGQNIVCNPSNFSITGQSFNLGWNNRMEAIGQSVIEEIASPTLNIETACSSVHNCQLGQLTGPDSLCVGQTAIFNTETFGDCGNASFSIDPAYATIVNTANNQVTLQFNQAGSIKLRTTLITGCGTQADSSIIHILPSALSFNMGSDSSICPNNTLLLNAKSGYQSYLWQDGSTDSLFAVHLPGTYYVTVTDYCGNFSTDTIHILNAPPISFDAGPDLSKCNNESLSVNATPGFLNYTWSPAYNISSITGQSVTVSPDIDTLYTVMAEKTPGCFAYDTVRVHVNRSPTINLGSDTSFCEYDSLVLDTGGGFQTYQWSTGAATQNIAVHIAGNYWIVATDANGCKSYDTLLVPDVYTKPVVVLPKDSTICSGTSQQLTPGTNFSSYSWSTGNSSNTILVNNIGTYSVFVTDNNGCKGSDSVRITTILPSPVNFLPIDTVLCNYLTLQIQPRSLFNSYLWNTGSTFNTITVSQPGIYWLQVKNNNDCIGRDSIVINPKQCLEGFFIPHAFTPNKDGNNDLFYPLLFGNVIKYRFSVYNRWGLKIFETSQLQKGWDGRVAGVETDTNVFVWICTYQFDGQASETKKGTVVLIR